MRSSRRSRAPAFEAGSKVAVLGLGVSGEAAARLAAARGGEVYASDVSVGPGPTAAAARLRSEGIDAECGGHDVDRVLDCDLVVVSPGIDPTSDIRRRVSDAGVRTIAEVELGWRDLRSRVVAITGTNGKTTTTGLVAHVLETGGLTAVAAGNIGLPLSEIALQESQPDWVALELSSFQLADQETVHPDIGVLLNLSPDHLDRYRDVQSYYADKHRLFEDATPDSRWVLNADDPTSLALPAGADGTYYHFSVSGPVDRGAYLGSDGVMRCRLVDEVEWMPATDLRLLGPHNVANSLAAGLACAIVGVGPESIARGLSTFDALPHRLQPVGEHDGILWVNDSKATNISATAVALRSFERPVVLILGGRHKGEPYSNLVPHMARIRAVVAYGEAAPRIVSDLAGSVDTLVVESGIDAVVRVARELAHPGDVVLLSPACSSYDMFPNYRERGRAFEAAVRALPTEGAFR
ncbi:MAG: UDP-N-acetylmuramoyl-L-alanine--D-glutamate ligase [Candidatus Palauibacterales bacterium]|nr:UDP-N-acetylmuramoyl-L-alanine--D-glutamate ligase [Candidatus Palauibacterales bacterium]MDP2482915.1 UDP-N-acetylmuramoyl-L-alanine--D-glutamate ligase [Candidatus Palauibacterales bacterium]